MYQPTIKQVELEDLAEWWIQPLRPRLWGDEAATLRSAELSPLYIQRYVGPRDGKLALFHSFWEMTFVFDGYGELWTDTCQPLVPSRLVLIPPGVVHCEVAEQQLDTLWIGMQGSLLGRLPSERIEVIKDSSLVPLCEQLWLSARRQHEVIGPELDGFLRTIVGRFLRLHADEQPGMRDIDTILLYIHEHLHEPLSVSLLAEHCGYSEGYFHRLFKQHVGISPNSYIAKSRVEKAIYLMQQNTWSIQRIASAVGYDDPLYFSRVFKKITGHAPSMLSNQRSAQHAPPRSEYSSPST